MEFKDKKILIIISGLFLYVIAFIIFIILKSKDEMISNMGRYKGEYQLNNENLGNEIICYSGTKINVNGDGCTPCNLDEYCPGNLSATKSLFCYRKQTATGNIYYEGRISDDESWIIIGHVGEINCNEVKSCYNYNGNYVWGDYNDYSGYNKIYDVTKQNDCKNFCWQKKGINASEYKESVTSPGNDWEKVGEVGTISCS